MIHKQSQKTEKTMTSTVPDQMNKQRNTQKIISEQLPHRTTISNKNTLSNKFSVNQDPDASEDSKSRNILDMVQEDESYNDTGKFKKKPSAQVKRSMSNSDISMRSYKKAHYLFKGCSFESLAKVVVVFDFLFLFLFVSFFVVYVFARFNLNS